MDSTLFNLLRRAVTPEVPGGIRALTLQKMSDYANGDQFGGFDGKYWRGRRPAAALKMDAVENTFTQDDQIGPGINRLVAAILGKDFEWTLEDSTVPEDGEQPPEVQAISDALTTWHVEARLHRAIRDAKRSEQWAGRSALRIFIPNVYADKAVEGSCATLEDALELIHILPVAATIGGVIRDEFERDLAYYYIYTVLIDGLTQQRRMELHTPTEIQTLNYPDLAVMGEPVPNPLFDPLRLRRPRFLMHNLDRIGGPVVTQSMIDLQDRLNISWTNLARNDDLAGYRTLVTLNAEGPTDADGQAIPWKMGPSMVINLTGTVLAGTAEHPESLASPSIMVIDPVNPGTFFIPSIEALRESLLESFDQLWTVTAGNRASGESKRESRKSFDKRVATEAANVTLSIVWAVKTVLRLAAWLQGKPLMYETIEVEPRIYLDVNNGDLATFQALLPAAEKGLVSLDTLVESNPAVTDAESELRRLELPMRLTPANVAVLVPATVLSQREGLIAMGFAPEDADRIVQERLEEQQLGAVGLAPVTAGP